MLTIVASRRRGDISTWEGRTFSLGDYTTWRPIGNLADSWYEPSEEGVQCLGSVLPDLDPATFQVSTAGIYAKDKNHVYRCDEIIENADVKSFTAYSMGGVGNGREYAKDKTHVYMSGATIQGADPATFSFTITMDEPYSFTFTKDRRNVYLGYDVLLGADPATFVSIYDDAKRSTSLFKDAHAVYGFNYGDNGGYKSISGADPETFSIDASGIIARDKDHVYAVGNGQVDMIPEADPKTFELVETIGEFASTGFNYFKDVSHVYYYDLQYYKIVQPNSGTVVAIDGADPATFAVSNETSAFDAQDKNYHYLRGEKLW